MTDDEVLQPILLTSSETVAIVYSYTGNAPLGAKSEKSLEPNASPSPGDSNSKHWTPSKRPKTKETLGEGRKSLRPARPVQYVVHSTLGCEKYLAKPVQIKGLPVR